MTPVAPEYGGPKVTPQSRPNARVADTASPAAFGVPKNVDLSGVAQVFQRHAQEQQDALDNAVITSKEVELSNLRTNLMTHATSALGVNALAASQEVSEQWQKGVSDVLGSLKNDRQKKAIEQRAQGYWANLYSAVESHVGAQINKQAASDVDALLGAELETVVHDPSQAPIAIQKATARLTVYGKLHAGWTPAELQQQIASQVSTIHATAINQWASDDSPVSTNLAKAYFDLHGPEMIGKQFIQAQKQVNAALEQDAGIEEADKILGLNQPEGGTIDPAQQQEQQGPATSRADALARAEAIADKNVRKAAVMQIMAHYRDLDALQRMDRQDALVSVTKQLEASGGRLNRGSKAWLSIDGTTEGKVALAHQQSLLHPPKDPGDPELHMSKVLLSNMSPVTQQAFLRESPKDWVGMNMTQQMDLVNEQNKIRASARREAVAEDKRLEEDALKAAAKIQNGDERRIEQQRIRRFYQAREMERAGTTSAPSAASAAGTPDSNDAPLLPPSAPTRLMLDGAAQNPEYAKLLRRMNVQLPDVLPAFPPEKPAAAPAKKPPTIEVQRDAAGRVTRLVPKE